MNSFLTLSHPGKVSWRIWGTLSATLAVLLVTPWFVGLFFPLEASIAAGATTLACLILLRYRAGREADDVPGLASAFDLRGPLVWVAAFGVYTLLTDLWAASVQLSFEYNATEVSALLLFILLWQHARQIAVWWSAALAVLGIALFTLGMGAAVGWWAYTDAVYAGHLLASVFQYHNTFGSVELAIGVLSFVAGMQFRSVWWNALGSTATVVSLAAVLGTYSREVYVIAPFAWTAALVLRYRIEKSRHTVATGVSLLLAGGATGYLVLKILKGYGQPALAGHDALLLVADFALAAGFGIGIAFLDRRLRAVEIDRTRFWGGLGIVALILLAAIYKLRHSLLGATGVGQKVQAISLHSVSLLERFYYYQDALRIWKYSPVIGGGGNSWGAEYGAFQTLPYTSNQVHSVFFDQLLNGGVIGLLLWVALLVVCGRVIVRGVRALPQDAPAQKSLIAALGLFAAVLLTHGLFDFDFSYGLIEYLFWGALGLACGLSARALAAVDAGGADMAGRAGARAPGAAAGTGAGANLRSHGEIRAAERQAMVLRRQRLILSVAGPVAVLGSGVSVLLFSVSLAGAQILSDAVAQSGSPYYGQVGPIRMAAVLAPYNAGVQLAIAQYDLQNGQNQGAWGAAQAAFADAGWNASAQGSAALIANNLHQSATAYAWGLAAAEHAPFNASLQQNAMGLTMWYGASLMRQQPAQARAYLAQVTQMARQYRARMKQIDLQLFPGATPMAMSPSIQVYEGTADYLLGKYAASRKAITPLMNIGNQPPDPTSKALYLADTALDEAHLAPGGAKSAIARKALAAVMANPQAKTLYAYLQSL